MQSVSELCAFFEPAVSARVPDTAARAKKQRNAKPGPFVALTCTNTPVFACRYCVMTCTHVCIRAQCMYVRALWVYVCAQIYMRTCQRIYIHAKTGMIVHVSTTRGHGFAFRGFVAARARPAVQMVFCFLWQFFCFVPVLL